MNKKFGSETERGREREEKRREMERDGINYYSCKLHSGMGRNFFLFFFQHKQNIEEEIQYLDNNEIANNQVSVVCNYGSFIAPRAYVKVISNYLSSLHVATTINIPHET